LPRQHPGTERVYDNTLPGLGAFELHLGPYHEFALFRGIQDEHRRHDSTANLLRPFNVAVLFEPLTAELGGEPTTARGQPGAADPPTSVKAGSSR
jgi:hypothetical protein